MASPIVVPLHPNDRRVRALALESLALLNVANDPRLSPSEFRRAVRSYRRAVARYQAVALRHRGFKPSGEAL